MGITRNKFYCSNNLNSSNFLSIQSLWGYEKDKLNNVLNSYVLGFKNDLAIFKLDFSLEYLVRCSIFCSNLVFNRTIILFLIPVICDTIYDNSLKELILFFSLRSLQPFVFIDKVNCFLNNIVVKKSCVLLTCGNKYDLFVRNSLANLIPFVYIEDIYFQFNKGPYSVVGNSNCIDYTFFWYIFFSNSILKSMLLSYCRSLIN